MLAAPQTRGSKESEVERLVYGAQTMGVGRDHAAAFGRREALSGVEAQRDREAAKEPRRIGAHGLEARAAVDDDGNACSAVEIQPRRQRHRSAERGHRDHHADLRQQGMVVQGLRLQLPAVGVHVDKVRTKATLLGR